MRAQSRSVDVESLELRQMMSATIAMFYDPKYVNTAVGSDGLDLLQQINYAGGNTVKTFSGIDAASISKGLAGTNLLLIPALDNGDLNASMTNSTKDVIRNFVSNGGGLIVTGDPQGRDTALLENLFNYPRFSGPYNSAGSDYPLVTSQATGTAFARGPATIAINSGEYDLNTGTVPANAKLIYHQSVPFSDDTAVMLLQNTPSGTRFPIAYLAWSWTNGGPNGTQDGGWNAVLDLAIKQVAGPLPSTPTPYSLVASALNQTTINLSWKDSTTNVTGFTIQRSATPTGTFATIGTTTAGVTTFSNTGLKASTPYSYRVFAAGPLGSSGSSAVSTATTYSNTFATLTAGKLTITGTADNDHITLTLKSGTLTIKQNALTQTFSNALVTSISVLEGNGNDVLAIGAGVGRVVAQGGTGNDEFIALNTAPDTFNGGGGFDTLYGNPNDTYTKIATVII